MCDDTMQAIEVLRAGWEKQEKLSKYDTGGQCRVIHHWAAMI
jgi:hypothetical protein